MPARGDVNARRLADEREALLWSLVNCFHSQMTRLDRAVDRITREMRDLEHAQDGTEVKAHELETLTDRVRNLPRADSVEVCATVSRSRSYCGCPGSAPPRPWLPLFRR